MCRRKCIYRGESGLCYYHLKAGKTRLSQIYEQRGSDVFTEEVRQLLRPRNCPFFKEGKPGKLPQQRITLPGSPSSTGRSRFAGDYARRLYDQGKTDTEIGQALGVSRFAIKRWRQKEGLSAHIDPRQLSFDERQALTLYEQGATDGEIGKAVGATANTIYAWRDRRGLPSKWKQGRPHG